MRPIQRRQQGLQYGIYLLCMQAVNFGIDKIPPVTLIGVIGQALLYVGLIQVPWNAEEGSYLEPMYGTANFLMLIALISLGCSSAYISLGYILTQLTGDYGYYTACAIGFSAVLFALKVIVVCEERDRLHDVGGFRVPSKIAVWVELVLIHLLVPNSSFTGHLGGILVGCLYCYTFVGELIDDIIYKITGNPIIHEEQFYRRRTRLFS